MSLAACAALLGVLPACSNEAAGQTGPNVLSNETASQPAATSPSNAKRPHVIVLVIDTLRADHLGFMGYARKTSPTLDEWAARSVVFDRAHAPAPWTVPSIASMFTGVHPSVHHVFDYKGRYISPGQAAMGDVLPDEAETLAEAFRAAGYQTAAFISNPYLGGDTGFGQGFGTYNVVVSKSHYVPAVTIFDHATRWMDNRDAVKPIFLYLHLMDVHQPYNAPRAFSDPFVNEVKAMPQRTAIPSLPDGPGHLGRVTRNTTLVNPELRVCAEYWIARYDAGIAHMDQQLKQLQALLERHEIWNDTILLVTADHGESLNDHGGWDHGYSPYEHELHVPLLVHCPARWAARRVPATVSLTDVKPTLLELAGVSSKEWMQGHSFAGLLRGEAGGERFSFSEGVKQAATLRVAVAGDRKVIRDAKSGQAVWFDLAKDPHERQPRSLPCDDATATALDRWLAAELKSNEENAKRYPNRQTPVSKSTVERLKSLGYLNGAVGGDASNIPPYGSFQFETK